MAALTHFAEALRILDARHDLALTQLHPLLRARVLRALERCGGRFKAWQGYRGPDEQEESFLKHASDVRFGNSAHNWRPSLAVDVVLDPRVVEVRARPDAPGWPDEWDKVSPAAVAAWDLLELAAAAEDLGRVTISTGRDLPHLEMPNWRSYIPV